MDSKKTSEKSRDKGMKEFYLQQNLLMVDNLIFIDLSCLNYCTLTEVNLTPHKLQSVTIVVDTLVPSLLNSC